MKDSELIAMAQEAGFPVVTLLAGNVLISGNAKRRFMRLVELAQESERKECAKTCHEIQMTRFAHDGGNEYHDGEAEGAKECWQAIRMRSNVKLRG